MKSTRGKQKEKYKTHIATPEFYTFYANRYFREVEEGNSRGVLHKDSMYYLTASEYARILDEFNRGIRDLIINESFDFILPSRMGVLGIRKRKLVPYIDHKGDFKNPLPVDWQSTYELWESDPEAQSDKTLIRFRNKHSGGYIAEWTLQRAKATFTNKSGYDFKASRTAKQLLGAVMLDFENNSIDYQLK